MLGCAYRDLGNGPRALENYQLAAAQADTLTAPDSTLNRLMRVHSQMSQIYLQQRLSEQMLEESRIAAHLAWKIGDSQSALVFEHDLCYNLYNNKEYAACIRHALALHQDFMQYGHKEDAQLAYIHCVKAYLALHDYVSAKKYLDEYEKCAYFQTNPEKVNGGAEALYRIKGEYYINIGQADSAIYYYQKAAREIRQGGNKLLLYNGLLRTYGRMHQADSVLKYAHLYSEAKEESFFNEQTRAAVLAKTMYNYSTEQRMAREKTAESARKDIILMLFFFITIIAVLWFLYYKNKEKNEIQHLIVLSQRTILELENTKEMLQSATQEKDRNEDLIATYQGRLDKQDAELNILRQKIQAIVSHPTDFNLNSAHIVKRFDELRLQGRNSELTANDWEDLRTAVEKAHPTLHDYVNSRTLLSEKEYRICLLVVAGFKPTDIAVIMGIKVESVSMIRNRLCLKVFSYEGKAGDFDRLLRRIYS